MFYATKMFVQLKLSITIIIENIKRMQLYLLRQTLLKRTSRLFHQSHVSKNFKLVCNRREVLMCSSDSAQHPIKGERMHDSICDENIELPLKGSQRNSCTVLLFRMKTAEWKPLNVSRFHLSWSPLSFFLRYIA